VAQKKSTRPQSSAPVVVDGPPVVPGALVVPGGLVVPGALVVVGASVPATDAAVVVAPPQLRRPVHAASAVTAIDAAPASALRREIIPSPVMRHIVGRTRNPLRGRDRIGGMMAASC